MHCVLVTSDENLASQLREVLVQNGHVVYAECPTLEGARGLLQAKDVDLSAVLWVVDSYLESPLPGHPDAAFSVDEFHPAFVFCRDLRRENPSPFILGLTRQGCANDGRMFDEVGVWHLSVAVSGWQALVPNSLDNVRAVSTLRLPA